ncbi:MAG TPA: glucosaminidase domain-containing protein [Bacteroidia bacterium]|nr:glucosaminidase domain-containing protein [Bacteroidia bacterium]
MKSSFRLIRQCIFVFLIALIFNSDNLFAFSDSTKVVVKKPKKEKYYKRSRIAVEDVRNYMDSIGILNSDIVLKQALLETGHFKAKLLMDKNNLFAFRFTKRYMSFINWQASVDYYKKWQDKFYTNQSENYYDFLKRIRYARFPHYIKVLKQVKARTAQ